MPVELLRNLTHPDQRISVWECVVRWERSAWTQQVRTCWFWFDLCSEEESGQASVVEGKCRPWLGLNNKGEMTVTMAWNYRRKYLTPPQPSPLSPGQDWVHFTTWGMWLFSGLWGPAELYNPRPGTRWPVPVPVLVHSVRTKSLEYSTAGAGRAGWIAQCWVNLKQRGEPGFQFSLCREDLPTPRQVISPGSRSE